MNQMPGGAIICFGSLIMDISIGCSRLPAMGETVYTYEDYQVTPGGKGGNQAAAAARSGGKVILVGRIADDGYARTLMKSFEKDRIDTSHLIVDREAATGVAFVWVDQDGHNSCLCSLGANARNTVQDIRSYEPLFQKGSIVMTTLEHSSLILEELTLMAKRRGCTVILDPSSRDYSKLTPALAGRIDILKPNEIEARMLTGICVETRDDAVKAIHILKEKGIRMPVISMGSRGVVYEDHGEVISVKGLDVSAVDTTAAGDTFIGCMAAKLSGGFSLGASIRYANRAAAFCVQHRGAQISIPFEENVL